MEGLGEVEHAALIFEDLGAQRLARGVAEQAFGEVHQALVVLVGLVELHHREFGVVARADAFVAEVAVDLEHLFEAADDQTLEVQLRRDAQEKLHVERVMVRDEGLGRGATGDGVHHRRFDFEEAVVDHVVADRLHHAAARHEGEARLLVGHQVEIALAVLLLGIREAAELLGQRTQRLGQQADLAGLDGQFAGLGFHHGADDPHDVAQVPVLEVGVDVLANGIAGDVELDAARHVLDGGEAGLAHDALEHHAAGDFHFDRHALEFFGALPGVELIELVGKVLAREIVREGLAGLPPFDEFGTSLGDKLVFILDVLFRFGRVLVLLGHDVSRNLLNGWRLLLCLQLTSRFPSLLPFLPATSCRRGLAATGSRCVPSAARHRSSARGPCGGRPRRPHSAGGRRSR